MLKRTMSNCLQLSRDRVRVDRSEMALHPPNFLFQHLVPETSFELALAQGRGGDLHSLLSSTEKNLEYNSIREDKAL
jgi:hypothetical protein